MAQIIQYGDYQFPEPHPIVAFSDNPIFISGVLDHAKKDISVIGFLTGNNLAELHTSKMQMISGFASGYQDLIIGSASGDSNTGVFSGCMPSNISFEDSDLTTLIPYTVSFTSLEQKSFSQLYGLDSPVDSWSYKENDNRVVSATHTVSVKGVKSSLISDDPLQRAFNFVSGRLNGFENNSILLTGDVGFLKSRNQNINRFNFEFGVTEEYSFTQSSMPINDSGIVTSEAKISYSRDAGLRVSIDGSIQGSITGTKLTTGAINDQMAQQLMINSVVPTMSQLESGVYALSDKRPKSYNYNIDTGANKIDFSFEFENLDNASQTGVVQHDYVTSISANKEMGIINVSVQGSLIYNDPFELMVTGDASTGARWIAVESEFNGVSPFALAKQGAIDFTSNVTGYLFDSSTLNPTPISTNVTKKPQDSMIDYQYSFDNRLDLSSGLLDNLALTVTDKRPLQVTRVAQSTHGFLTQLVNERTAGEYSIQGSCDNGFDDLPVMSGIIANYSPNQPSVETSLTISTGSSQITLGKGWLY
jgi:hypothetical protein